jgi:hypothetical protein
VVTAVIPKPFTSGELRAVMERVIEASRGHAATAGSSAE